MLLMDALLVAPSRFLFFLIASHLLALFRIGRSVYEESCASWEEQSAARGRAPE